jgi:hypothetical protein
MLADVSGEALSPDARIVCAEPWLQIYIHDSDFTAVTYRPTGAGSGSAYLGDTPRTYFQDEDASPLTDVEREAVGLTQWWSLVHGATAEEHTSPKQVQIRRFLAADLALESLADDGDDAESIEDEDVFVEIKTGAFLTTLDLPLPQGLAHVAK